MRIDRDRGREPFGIKSKNPRRVRPPRMKKRNQKLKELGKKDQKLKEAGKRLEKGLGLKRNLRGVAFWLYKFLHNKRQSTA